MGFQVTTLIAGLLTLMMVPLSLQVSFRRRGLMVSYGDGDDPVLKRRIRAHGNFIEYVPTGLIALGLVEWNGGAPQLVWGLGAALVVSRLLHAAGTLYMNGPAGRAAGMMIQHAVFITAGVWLVRAFSA